MEQKVRTPSCKNVVDKSRFRLRNMRSVYGVIRALRKIQGFQMCEVSIHDTYGTFRVFDADLHELAYQFDKECAITPAYEWFQIEGRYGGEHVTIRISIPKLVFEVVEGRTDFVKYLMQSANSKSHLKQKK